MNNQKRVACVIGSGLTTALLLAAHCTPLLARQADCEASQEGSVVTSTGPSKRQLEVLKPEYPSVKAIKPANRAQRRRQAAELKASRRAVKEMKAYGHRS